MSEVYTPDCYMARRLRGRYPERYGEDGIMLGSTMKQDVEIDVMKEARSGRFGTLEVNLVLRNRKQFFFRLWLAAKLCTLAVWVSPVPGKVTEDEDE